VTPESATAGFCSSSAMLDDTQLGSMCLTVLAAGAYECGQCRRKQQMPERAYTERTVRLCYFERAFAMTLTVYLLVRAWWIRQIVIRGR
jgi:hypothetical protein